MLGKHAAIFFKWITIFTENKNSNSSNLLRLFSEKAAIVYNGYYATAMVDKAVRFCLAALPLSISK